jgi:hypothetical protein
MRRASSCWFSTRVQLLTIDGLAQRRLARISRSKTWATFRFFSLPNESMQVTEQIQNQNDDENGSDCAVRPVAESITACRKSAD